MIYPIPLFQRSRHVKEIFSVIACSLLSLNVAAATDYVDSDIRVSCQQTHKIKIECDYQLLKQRSDAELKAYYEDELVTISSKKVYPWPGAKTNILLLVDTSDPGRGAAVKAIVQHIKALLNLQKEQQHFALASFDEDFTLLSSFNESKDILLDKLSSLSAKGLTTELYRNLLQAIKMLAKTNADKKIIYVFSDGLAEDKAYYHADIINAALKNDVLIHSIGYPRSVSQSVALQVLRRISEETGGLFIATDNQFQIDKTKLKQIATLDNTGNRVSFSLTDLFASPGEPPLLQLKLTTTDNQYFIDIPIHLENKIEKPIATYPPTTTPNELITSPLKQNKLETITTPHRAEPAWLDLWLWYGVPIALLMLIILTLITIYLLYKRQPAAVTTIPHNTQTPHPFAYLIEQTAERTQYAITKTLWRIGRSVDNETSLDDNSISRFHAEIHRNDSGEFSVQDMRSTNGVFVNDKKTRHQQLQEGDIIEIGDVFLRFTQQNPGHIQLDKTSIQRTKNPEF